MPDAPSPAKLALSALVLAASDAALLAIAVSPLAPPDLPEDLRLPALARGALEHLREQASSLSLRVKRL